MAPFAWFFGSHPTRAKGVVTKQGEAHCAVGGRGKARKKFKHKGHEAHEEEINRRLMVDRILPPGYL
jgi:hypothetical protein